MLCFAPRKNQQRLSRKFGFKLDRSWRALGTTNKRYPLSSEFVTLIPTVRSCFRILDSHNSKHDITPRQCVPLKRLAHRARVKPICGWPRLVMAPEIRRKRTRHTQKPSKKTQRLSKPTRHSQILQWLTTIHRLP